MALVFGGNSSSYGTVAAHSDFNTTAWTMLAWVRWSSTPASDMLACVMNSGALRCYLFATSTPRIRIYHQRATTSMNVETNYQPTVNTWHCIVGTFDGGSNAKIYYAALGLSGSTELVEASYYSNTPGSGTVLQILEDLVICNGNPGTYGWGLPGRLARFCFWNSYMTLAEARRQMWRITPSTSLKLWLEPWDTSLVPDWSGRGHPMTPTSTSVGAHAPLPAPFVRTPRLWVPAPSAVTGYQQARRTWGDL